MLCVTLIYTLLCFKEPRAALDTHDLRPTVVYMQRHESPLQSSAARLIATYAAVLRGK